MVSKTETQEKKSNKQFRPENPQVRGEGIGGEKKWGGEKEEGSEGRGGKRRERGKERGREWNPEPREQVWIGEDSLRWLSLA